MENSKKSLDFSYLLGLHLKGYEERKEQQEMAQDVFEAFTREAIAFIEAGTGTGKSLAYLIPTILWAKEHQDPVVISTNTIALQEQLIEKDIPLAMKALGVTMKYVLAKGMGNYACQRKLSEAMEERSLFPDENLDEIVQIEAWSQHTEQGTRTDLPFVSSSQGWQKVAADADSCTGSHCPFFGKCFLFKARKEAQEAKIIVVNHHLLFADIAVRMESKNFSGPALLPAYKRLILDESHHIEDIATTYFAEKISRQNLLKILSQFDQNITDRSPGRLAILHLKLKQLLKNESSHLIAQFEQDIAAKKRALLFLTNELFDSLVTFCTLCSTKQEQKLRIRKSHVTHPYWNETLLPRSQALSSGLVDLALSLLQFEEELNSLKSDTLKEQTKALRADLKATQEKISLFSRRIKSFFMSADYTEKIYWIHIQPYQENVEVELVQVPHDVSKLLRENVIDKMSTTVFCSATLAAKKSFSYMRSRMGIRKDENLPIIEKIYSSPFDFEKQVLFGCPSDMPPPESPLYTAAANQAIKELIQASNGNAFVLFTSYEQLKSAYETLYQPLSTLGYHLLKQGDDHRQNLITRFKKKPRSVLFGTDSFWEGVDIVGDALRSVIITKLPFPVPSDPISEAKSELIVAQGRSPFIEYSLPKAIMKFKQAFGRLIRHKDDRGCCICLDVRLIKKGYGKVFTESLPNCLEAFEPLDTLKAKMVDFYKSGFLLRKSKEHLENPQSLSS